MLILINQRKEGFAMAKVSITPQALEYMSTLAREFTLYKQQGGGG